MIVAALWALGLGLVLALPSNGVFRAALVTIAAVGAFAAFVQVIGASSQVSRYVPNSVINSSPCAQWGGIRSVLEQNDAGPYPLYQVTCRDGVQIPVAQ